MTDYEKGVVVKVVKHYIGPRHCNQQGVPSDYTNEYVPLRAIYEEGGLDAVKQYLYDHKLKPYRVRYERPFEPDYALPIIRELDSIARQLNQNFEWLDERKFIRYYNRVMDLAHGRSGAHHHLP